MALGLDAIRATTWSFVQNAGGRVLSFVVFIVLARLLSADDFGTITLATAIMMVCAVLLEAGCTEALVQRASVSEDDVNSVFWATLAISILLATLVFLLGGALARVFSVPALEPILSILAFTLPFAAIGNVLAASLRRQLAFKALALRTFIVNLASAAIGIAMAVSGMGVWSLVGKTVAESVMSVLVLWAVTRWRPMFRVSRQSVLDMAPFGLNFLASRIASLLSNSADKWIAGYFLGTHALGIYNTAQRVFALPQELLPVAANNVLLPALARVQAEPTRARRALLKTIRSVALLGYPVFGLLVILMPDLVRLGLGPTWEDAIVPARILCAGGIVLSITYLLPAMWLSQGRASWHFRYTLFNGLANIGGFLIGVHWGPSGLCLAYVLRGALITFPLSLYLVRRAGGCTPREILAALALPMVVAASMVAVTGAIGLLLPSTISSAARIAILAPVALLAFGGLLSLLARHELRSMLEDFCSAFPSARRFFPGRLQRSE